MFPSSTQTFGEAFKPTDLSSYKEGKRLLPRICRKTLMRLMIKKTKQNKSLTTWIMLLGIYQTTGYSVFCFR